MATLIPAAIVLVAAGPAAQLDAGEWEVTGALDGSTTTRRLCISPAEAATPAFWFTRDTATPCTLVKRKLGGGNVDIEGKCAPPNGKSDPDRLDIEGTYAPDAFALRYETLSHGVDDKATGKGTITGKRLGACPG